MSVKQQERRRGALVRFSVLAFEDWRAIALDFLTDAEVDAGVAYQEYLNRKRQEESSLIRHLKAGA